jgi:hypothetical protein
MPREPVVARQTHDLQADEALLEARHFFSQFTPEGTARAAGSLTRGFLQALAVAPASARVHELHGLITLLLAINDPMPAAIRWEMPMRDGRT